MRKSSPIPARFAQADWPNSCPPVRLWVQSSILNPQSPIRRGFTLLEVLISLAVISCTLAAVLHLQLVSVNEGMCSGYYTTAIFLAQKVLNETYIEEELEQYEEGDFVDYPDYKWKREVRDTDLDLLQEIELVLTGPENTRIILHTYRVKEQ